VTTRIGDEHDLVGDVRALGNRSQKLKAETAPDRCGGGQLFRIWRASSAFATFRHGNQMISIGKSNERRRTKLARKLRKQHDACGESTWPSGISAHNSNVIL
jgi:hypothetical protein